MRFSKLIRFAIKAAPVVYPLAKELLKKRKEQKSSKSVNNKKRDQLV
ncbi:hypothetical protein [Lederbergia citri]|uniref:Uncharacterized protein n=1 Tax=Lederbergia citri TaxID=2833580 RepID=A0A942YGC8_9BACI|nr:hypothetical protein [Lederbergia citri]MBS4196008.1 hypothetical protein [Lederbergia citri]